MRVVADTNIIVSGLLWNGNERSVMDAARDGIIELCTSRMLLDDLEDVLSRPKFATRLTLNNIDRRVLVDDYSELAEIVSTAPLQAVMSRDPDDDEVLACAIAGDCEIIVTGDDDLLVLNEYRGIRIVRTLALIAELNL